MQEDKDKINKLGLIGNLPDSQFSTTPNTNGIGLGTQNFGTPSFQTPQLAQPTQPVVQPVQQVQPLPVSQPVAQPSPTVNTNGLPNDTRDIARVDIPNLNTSSLVNEETEVDTFLNAQAAQIGASQEDVLRYRQGVTSALTGRQAAYEKLGINKDLQDIAGLQSQVEALSGADTVLDQIGRERLSGKQATQRDLTDVTFQDKRQARLDSFFKSQELNARSRAVQVNKAIVDQYVTDSIQANTFNYNAEYKVLENAQMGYKDIITTQMNNALDYKKAVLDNNKTKYESLQKTVPAMLDELSTYDLPQNEYQRIAGSDSFEMRLELNKLQDQRRVGNLDTSKSRFIDDILSNPKALESISGGARPGALFGLNQSAKDARANIERIMYTVTFDTFLDAKAAGATFGAMSQGEWDILKKKSGAWGYNNETGNFDISEAKLKTELKDMQKTFMIGEIRQAKGDKFVTDLGLRNKSFDEVRNNHTQYTDPANIAEQSRVDNLDAFNSDILTTNSKRLEPNNSELKSAEG